MYCFISTVTNNRKAGVITAIAYAGAPYIFTNSVIRYAAGELLAMAVAPWVFLGIWKIQQGKSGWLPLGLGAAALLLSHNLSTAIFALFAVLFLLTTPKVLTRPAALKQLFGALLVAVGLSAFFVYPLLEARNAANYNVFDVGFMFHLSEVLNHAHSSLGSMWAGTQVPYGALGVLGVFSLGFAGFALTKSSDIQIKRFLVTAIVLIGISLLISSSIFPWTYLPSNFWVIQFPWRVNIVTALFLAALPGIVFSVLSSRNEDPVANVDTNLNGIPSAKSNTGECAWFRKPKWAAIAAVVAVGALAIVDFAVMAHSVDITRENTYDWSITFLGSMGPHNVDYLPSATREWDFFNRNHLPLALDGAMEFTNIERTGRQLDFEALVHQGGTVELPLFFYPGWRAYVDGARVPLFESENGFAAIELPSSEFSSTSTSQVTAYYAMSPATQAGATVTAATVLGLLAIATRRALRLRALRTSGSPAAKQFLTGLKDNRRRGASDEAN